MPVGHHLLLASLTVDAKLLAIDHAALHRPIVADLLALRDAGLAVLDVLRPVHMAIGDASLRPLNPLRTRLLALGALHALGTLRPRLVTLGPLRPLGSDEMPGMLDPRRLESLALRTRGMTAATAAPTLHLSALATATALLGGGSMAILTPTIVGPRTCRG
jgi:hypothetical protein